MPNTWEKPDVVEHYVRSTELQPCEEYLFNKYLSGGHLLDIGVGGGRTSTHLLSRAQSYIGVDYSQPMTDACSKRFPGVEFVCADASDLTVFANERFNSIVFSFNGIGCLPTDSLRLRCLSEFNRLLQPGGLLIFSVHNSRRLVHFPRFDNAGWLKRIWRCCLAVLNSLRLTRVALTQGAFLRGHGYIWDQTHGGFRVYQSTPLFVTKELDEAGFDLQEVVGANFPRRTPSWTEGWYYYVARKK